MRLFSSGKARVAVALAVVAAASAAGTRVALADQPQAAVKAEDPRTCGASTNHTFSGISVAARACLQRFPGGPLAIAWSADVKVTVPAGFSGYCRVDLEGSMHAVGQPHGISSLSCADFVNKGITVYRGGMEDRATSDGWSRVTVLIGANKGPVQSVSASYDAIL